MRRPRCQKSCITKNKVSRFRFYPIGRGEHLDLIVPCLYEDPRLSVMSSFEEFRVVLYHDIWRKSVMKFPSQFVKNFLHLKNNKNEKKKFSTLGCVLTAT